MKYSGSDAMMENLQGVGKPKREKYTGMLGKLGIHIL